MKTKKKPFTSRAEKYKRHPTLRNRSLLVAQKLDALKADPDFKDFRKILSLAKIQILELGRLDKYAKRKRVIEALKNYFCELDELAEETKLDRKDIKKILRVLIRAKLVRVKFREHFLNPDGSHGSHVFFWHESE